MDVTEAKNLIDVLADRSTAWYSLWTLFSTVGASFIVYMANDKLLARARAAASTIAVVAFLVFATGNYRALEEMRVQREALAAFVKAKAAEKGSTEIQAIATASAPPTAGDLKAYHWTLSALIVVLLAVIPRFLAAPKHA